MILVNLLSAVQIVLESFPVSSSGNVTLLMGFLSKLIGVNQVPALCQQFLFFLHGPTVIVLGVFFFKQWHSYFVKLFPFTFTLQRNAKYDASVYPLVVFGFITNAITVFFYALNNYFEFTSFFPVPLWLGFLVTTLLLFTCRQKFLTFIKLTWPAVHSLGEVWIPRCALDDERGCNALGFISCHDEISSTRHPEASNAKPWDPGLINNNHFNPFTAGVLLGLAQSVALFVPGISRFASTFVVGRWVGFAPAQALEYSFLIEMPLITAGFLKGFWWIIKTPEGHAFINFSFIMTLLISTILGYLGLMLVARLVERNKIWLFGFYTGLLAVISFAL